VIIAQRLIRKICESCKAPKMIRRGEIIKDISDETITRHFGQAMNIQVFEGRGCKVCHATGYSGRIGIFEVIEMTEKIKALITQKADSDEINRQAILDGMTTMLDDGLDKVVAGVTTIREVLRVTKVETM